MMKNKQGVIVALAVMLVFVGIISVLSVKAAGNRGNGGKTVFAVGGEVELRNTIELPISEVGALEVIYTSRSIKVYPTEGDMVVIKEYLLDEHKEGLATVTYEEMEGELSDRKKAVVKGNQDNVITVFGFNGGNERIEIYLPKAGLDSLHIQSGSGSVKAQDDFMLETKELQIATASGSIKWYATKAERMRIQAKSGSIELRDIEADLEVEASSGSIKLEDYKGRVAIAANSGSVKVLDAEGTLSVATGSGSVKVEKCIGTVALATGSGSVSVENLEGCGGFATGSGSIKVEMTKVTGDVSLESGSGSARLTLPEELSFTLEAKSGSGSIDTDFDEALSYNKKGNEATGVVGENPTCTITVETKSGKIDIAAE